MAISRIFAQARQAPDKTAVVHNGVSFSYAQFAQRITVVRAFLAMQNLRAGSVAIIAAGNLLDAWAIGFALRSLGLDTVAARGDEPVSALGLRGVSCVVTTSAEPRPASLDSAASSAWRLIHIPQESANARRSVADTETDMRGVPHGGHILLTSGTTGEYKKVLRSAATEDCALALLAEVNGISGQSLVYVANFGLWTAGGHRWPLYTWKVGGTVVIHQASDLHTPLQNHRLTHIFATPVLLADVLRAAPATLRRNDAMRLLVTGGAMTRALLAAAKQRLTNQVYSVLSATETSAVSVTCIEQPEDLLWHRIHPSREVQVVDESDRVLAGGEEGLVRIRIIDGLRGYLDDEAATREFFRDGYFYPGDLGRFGSDGRLMLGGRATDVLNLYGNKIATGPIEQRLQDRFGLEGACIVSIRGASGEDEVHLVIQASREFDSTALEASAKAELGIIGGVPVHIDRVAALPRNAMGKIPRLVLKQQLIPARADNANRPV